MLIPDEISQFISEHFALTIAVSSQNGPYCASCFYIFDPAGPDFVFSSSRFSFHAEEMLKMPVVAACIHKETANIQEIQGVQICGRVRELSENHECRLIDLYRDRFTFPGDIETAFWAIRANYIKMTDNTAGFGYKRVWQGNELR